MGALAGFAHEIQRLLEAVQRRRLTRGGFSEADIDEHPCSELIGIGDLDRSMEISERGTWCALARGGASRIVKDLERPGALDRSGHQQMFCYHLGFNAVGGQ